MLLSALVYFVVAVASVVFALSCHAVLQAADTDAMQDPQTAAEAPGYGEAELFQGTYVTSPHSLREVVCKRARGMGGRESTREHDGKGGGREDGGNDGGCPHVNMTTDVAMMTTTMKGIARPLTAAISATRTRTMKATTTMTTSLTTAMTTTMTTMALQPTMTIIAKLETTTMVATTTMAIPPLPPRDKNENNEDDDHDDNIYDNSYDDDDDGHDGTAADHEDRSEARDDDDDSNDDNGYATIASTIVPEHA